MRRPGYWFAFALLCAGLSFGGYLEHRRMQPKVDAAEQLAVRQSEIAKGWQRHYDQVYPLVTQWRRGYEHLRKRCGDGR